MGPAKLSCFPPLVPFRTGTQTRGRSHGGTGFLSPTGVLASEEQPAVGNFTMKSRRWGQLANGLCTSLLPQSSVFGKQRELCPWQQQAPNQVFGGHVQWDTEKELWVTLGAAPACVSAVQGLILPSGHLLLRGRVTRSPGIRHYGRCHSSAALAHSVSPSAPRLSSRSVDRGLQAEVPQTGRILHLRCGQRFGACCCTEGCPSLRLTSV